MSRAALLLLADGRFPAGGYAHSGGLEASIAAGRVRDVADLEAVAEWLAGDPQHPLVIDAKIADDSGSWWLAEAFRGH